MMEVDGVQNRVQSFGRRIIGGIVATILVAVISWWLAYGQIVALVPPIGGWDWVVAGIVAGVVAYIVAQIMWVLVVVVAIKGML